jgi:diaminopimelate epimerase
MLIQFHKYQGTGNDFIILDNRDNKYNQLTNQIIKDLCDRRFGIGADGLMLLNANGNYDFEMKYFNSDGLEGSMCGNGGRCLVKFAWEHGNRKSKYLFKATDGDHEAELDFDGIVSLRMNDVKEIKEYHGDFLLDTGSPHYVKMVDDVMHYDVVRKGKEIRRNHDFNEEGINVNFVQQESDDHIIVRTYERGVEDETLSCGTGVTASAIVCFHNEIGFNDVTVKTLGGKLSIQFDRTQDDTYTNVWLSGPAEKVFEGTIEV